MIIIKGEWIVSQKKRSVYIVSDGHRSEVCLMGRSR